MGSPAIPLLSGMLALLCLNGVGVAQDLKVSVDRETFFEDDPAWILSVRGAIGGDMSSRKEVYPILGLVVGYAFGNHFYLGGNTAVRLTRPNHFRFNFQLGVFFRALLLDFVTGVSLGVLTMPAEREVGGVATWGLELRYRVSKHHFLLCYAEADMLFKVLGFRQNRALLSAGLGWSFAF